MQPSLSGLGERAASFWGHLLAAAQERVKRTHQQHLNADNLFKDVHLHLGVAVVYNDAQQNIASPFAQFLTVCRSDLFATPVPRID
jgi:hypothetical protein